MNIQTSHTQTQPSPFSPLSPEVAIRTDVIRSGSIVEAPVLQGASGAKSLEAYEAKAIQALAGETHLEEDKQLIHQLIKKPTELHFYWSFGREVEGYPVRIGGEAYHERFTRYLNKLLEVSPDLLKVVLALDDLTLRANQVWIEFLQLKYPNRLELRLIGDAQAKLEKAFPKYSETIQQVFANASRGNPVIVSDIYRLLCMVDPAKAENTIFTYCDVDKFVYGCDTTNSQVQKRPQLDFETKTFTFIEVTVDIPGHKNLIQALFQEPRFNSEEHDKNNVFRQERDPNQSFFLCRPMQDYKNNDIVKIKIKDLTTYISFSDDILKHLEKHLKDTAKPLNILNYFTKLHSYIKAFKNKLGEAEHNLFEAYSKEFNALSVSISDVIDVTGPEFLDQLNVCSPLGVVTPRVASWEWHGTQLVSKSLSVALSNFSSKNPCRENTQALFDLYANRLNDALYAKKFGEDHPFYLFLRHYLVQAFPYDQQYFENLVKEEYKLNLNMSKEGFPSYEEWKHDFLAKIKTKAPDDRPVEPGDSYYARLLSIVNTLGINVE